MSTLARARQLLATITPGPWRWDDRDRARWQLIGTVRTPILRCATLLWPAPPDAALIAEAPTIIAGLLDVIERVKAIHTESDFFIECQSCDEEWPCPTIRALGDH